MATESDERRDARLDRMREAYQERLAAETAQEREPRQWHGRERSVQTKMWKFHGQIASLNSPQCTTCGEKFPSLRLGCDSTECMCGSHAG